MVGFSRVSRQIQRRSVHLEIELSLLSRATPNKFPHTRWFMHRNVPSHGAGDQKSSIKVSEPVPSDSRERSSSGLSPGLVHVHLLPVFTLPSVYVLVPISSFSLSLSFIILRERGRA